VLFGSRGCRNDDHRDSALFGGNLQPSLELTACTKQLEAWSYIEGDGGKPGPEAFGTRTRGVGGSTSTGAPGSNENSARMRTRPPIPFLTCLGTGTSARWRPPNRVLFSNEYWAVSRPAGITRRPPLRPEGGWVNLILTIKIQPQIALVSGKCLYSKLVTTFSRRLHS
jgi:hypothetical protein